MRYFVSFIMGCVLIMPAVAATPAGQGRRSMASQMVAAPRHVSMGGNSQAQMASAHVGLNANPNNTTNSENTNNNTEEGATAVKPNEPVAPLPNPVDKREKEKMACINGNIGIGNTFVWASRYSNTGSYASMVEDVENPENNTCFVRVELKSSDSKVDLSSVPGQYFEMGRTITCGSWADEESIKKRILDAKKSARTWGTVAGVVGGAGVGVGAMELFGNKLIGGAVQGQKALDEDSGELLVSQLKVLKKDNSAKLKEYMCLVYQLIEECDGNESVNGCRDIAKYKKVKEVFGADVNEDDCD